MSEPTRMEAKWEILQGDCLEVLRTLPENGADSLVTDPPAGISFMGKSWDSDKGGRREWIAWLREVMTETHRVLKPGAHGLIWGLPRTCHWTATALEDAGFEIRDVITHLFGQGFPKSLDVSKAIDKAAGIDREVTQEGARKVGLPGQMDTKDSSSLRERRDIPATDAAKQWQGWGTALKPAAEFWILVRKPCSEKTVAANVQKWGTGALNIDGSRIEGVVPKTVSGGKAMNGGKFGDSESEREMYRVEWENTKGRFPANLVLSHSPYCTEDQCDIECAVYGLDLQSGERASGGGGKGKRGGSFGDGQDNPNRANALYFDKGGASRFFYCAKISASERNAGLDEMPDRKGATLQDNGKDFKTGSGNPRNTIVKNHHPTVKPTKLMGYLTRMITPHGGTVLDPFAGSGSTGIACKREGYSFIGIEREPDYVEIARRRIEAWRPEPAA